MTDAGRAVGRFARDFAAALDLDADPPGVPEPRFVELAQQAKGFGSAEARAAAIDMLALAHEMEAAGGEHVDMILAQLFVLAEILVAQEDAPGSDTHEALRQARLRRAVGHEKHHRPVPSGRASGAQSVLATRLGTNRPKKEP